MFVVPEKYRVTNGAMGSNANYGNNGYFLVSLQCGTVLTVIASDEVWEHVSVSRKKNPPTYDQLMSIKALFWGPGDLVVQLHVGEGDHINIHPNCLHLWRKRGTNNFCELPPKIFV